MKKKSNGWSILGAVGAIAYVAYKERQRDKIFHQNQQRQQIPPREKFTVESEPMAPKFTKEELHSLWVSLSMKYHPDRAQSDRDKEFRTSLIAKINNAYQAGDMATLKMFQ